MAKLTQEEILAYLDEATILELNELVKAIEEKYGVSAAAPVAVAAAPAEEANAAPSTVTVVLTSFGDSKVGVIKVVREITGLGLVDAKKHDALVLKGGIVEGKVVGVDVIKELSALPNREGMLSMLLSVLQAPVSQFARAVNAVAEARGEGAPVEAKEEVKEEAAEAAA